MAGVKSARLEKNLIMSSYNVVRNCPKYPGHTRPQDWAESNSTWNCRALWTKDSQSFMAKIVSSTVNEPKDPLQLDFKEYKISLLLKSL